ncbi:MAG: EamA family transporter [Anaerolineae bacterium]
MSSDPAGGASGLLLGLASAVSWGAGDFGGGLAARRGNVYGVVAVSQALGLVLLAGLALLLAEPPPAPVDLTWGAAAGLAGGLGLVALYRGLALGRMGVAAPLAAVVSAGLPVLFGGVVEGLPNPTQIAGFSLALAAVWLLSRSEGDGPARLRWSELGLPLLAGLGFGLFLIIIDHASERAVLWPLVAARGASLALMAGLVLGGHRGAPSGREVLPGRRLLGLVALVGLFDTGGNALYALAAQAGRLDVAATLSSLYPATTVLLARLILKERLAPRQWLGAVAALAAVVLIAA